MEITSKSDLLYQQLCRRIAEMKDGVPFPTVRQLMAEYQVSQATVSPAIALLKERGLLESVPRQGMFVRRERAGKAPKILLFQPDWEAENLRQVKRELERAASSRGFLLETIHFDYHRDVCGMLNDCVADVIVVDAISNDQLKPEQIMQITQAAAPVILSSNAVPVESIRYVCGDNSAGAALAARFLAQRGHCRIGMLYCEPHIHASESIVRSFNFVAATCGCRVTLLDCGMRPGDTPDRMIRRFAGKIRDGKYDFTALFAISDDGALKMLRELEALNVGVPGDLSILGFGGVRIPGGERLTTIDTPRCKMADAVMEMAANILAGRTGFEGQVNIMPELVERQTVKTLPVFNIV